MNPILAPADIGPDDLGRVGGKALCLAALSRAGFTTPSFFCVTTDAYHAFLDATGLRERILMELHRKAFHLMRWEEIWDCATRIRNLFLRPPFPHSLATTLERAVAERFADRPVVVRSSAPDEDQARSSFAGLHASYVHVRGAGEVLEHLRMVWASLWSDAALLYRQELGLDVAHSAMAVVVQELVVGRSSGICFSQSPTQPSQALVEAVHGLNQALVDGEVEPDRWVIDRDFDRLLEHRPVQRTRQLAVTDQGLEMVPLPVGVGTQPPLSPAQVMAVYGIGRRAERCFGTPQDVEWTLCDGELYLLQSRPVTARAPEAAGDQRSWYLSLHRSFDNLKQLRQTIENEHIPAMVRVARELATVDLQRLTDEELAVEIHRRREINNAWVGIYWTDFIPFAHGIRLFGQVFNDRVKPADPYAFVALLTHTEMASLERNRLLASLAEQVRRRPELADCLSRGDCAEKAPEFRRAMEGFIERFGDLSCSMTGGVQCEGATRPLVNILLALSARPRTPPPTAPQAGVAAQVQRFLDTYPPERRQQGRELLDLARASYRLRDDDNIHLGRIEAELAAAAAEGRRRLERPGLDDRGRAALQASLEGLPAADRVTPGEVSAHPPDHGLRPRQLTGQPASPGVARGRARVVRRHAELADFAQGEVLVCDAVDPNMTFVVPLAAAVVERRGGMLIHGAIIAREYGLPCVTGIPDATDRLHTGELLTVDGYLGIVTVATGDDPPTSPTKEGTDHG